MKELTKSDILRIKADIIDIEAILDSMSVAPVHDIFRLATAVDHLKEVFSSEE